MKIDYDVTMVGAGHAGSTTAKYLAEKGFNDPGEKILTRFLLHISFILIWYGGLNPSSTLFYYRNTNISFDVMQNTNI